VTLASDREKSLIGHMGTAKTPKTLITSCSSQGGGKWRKDEARWKIKEVSAKKRQNRMNLGKKEGGFCANG